MTLIMIFQDHPDYAIWSATYEFLLVFYSNYYALAQKPQPFLQNGWVEQVLTQFSGGHFVSLNP